MKTDILIIGSGPAGLSFARSLADSALKVVVVEKMGEDAIADPAPDGRDIALTHRSRQILTDLGALKHIADEDISPIKEAKVLDGDSPYVLHFDYRRVCDDALGYLISNHLIRKALYQEVKAASNVEMVFDSSVKSISPAVDSACVTLSNGTEITSRLVVAADSRFSESRRMMGVSASMQDFGRTIVVCQMQHDEPHQGVAYECFRYGNTLAALPLRGNTSSIVVTVANEQVDGLLAMSDQQFGDYARDQLEGRFGNMSPVGKRFHYPLVAVLANQFYARRFALIGDACVGMHPVTAHGFNLGLLGQDTLASLIKEALHKDRDIAPDDLLRTYQSRHRIASMPLYLGTNAIVKLYTNDLPVPKILRKAMLRFGNNFSPVKAAITRHLTETHKLT
ncbi:MAG: 5-demethoxyubiquinol-8 5-hydroxylase UbiM [Halieaceae bacterium]|jgi:ubiquinone biosynthesis UbiH/UbiF/VisC/COQ6 family hydroxylase|nr:5-demethoxyubiquinol-8 5-hydroxylase UbiM [Halieaceae bacterium]